MVAVGPTGEESDAEIDDNPSPGDVRATVEWATKTDNIELADFDFEIDGEVGPHLQLLNDLTYNLTKLNDARLETAQAVLDEYETEEKDVESPHLTVTVDADTEEHKHIVEDLLDDVYDTSLADVEEIRRSTVEVVDEVEFAHIEGLASEPGELRAETEDAIGYTDGDTGGYIELEGGLNLNAIAIGLGLENVEYEPNRVPAVVYRVDRPEVTVLIFEDGQLVTVDADDDSAAQDALTKTAERLAEVGLYEGETPTEPDVEVSSI
jgi:hypothetical protein